MKKVRINRLSVWHCRQYVTSLALMAACSLAGAQSLGDCQPWDPALGQPGMNGAVYSLAVFDNGDIIAGGNFTSAGDVDANRIARWDGQQWHALGDGMDESVVALAVLDNGDLIAGGFFSSAGGEPANGVARWDGSQWHALGDGVDGTAWDLAVLESSGDLIVAGTFTTAGKAPAMNIARWDGRNWHAMGSGFDASVRTLSVLDTGDGPVLYAGGLFTMAGDVRVNHIARWDGQSAAWMPLDEGVNGPVRALQAFDDGIGPALYVAGQITHAGRVPLFNPIGRWDGQQWWPFSGGLHGEVTALAVHDDGKGPSILAAGGSAAHVKRWDGSWWKPIASPASNSVYALASSNGKGGSLIVGGSFTMVGDEQAGGIARVQPCPAPQPLVRYVPAEYATIQAAIDAADDGDVVLVAPGTYNEAIDFLGKTIVIESEAGAERTIIDAAGLNTSVVVGVPAGSRAGTELRGFTVTGGSNPETQTGIGIGIMDATITIDSCIVSGNEQQFGGGIRAFLGADILVTKSTIVNNHSQHNGAGVVLHQNCGARIHDCVIASNTAYSGAGIMIFHAMPPQKAVSKGMFTRCIIEDNATILTPNGAGWGGGGAANAGVAYFDDCDFRANTATAFAAWNQAGGGLHASGLSSETFLRNSRFEQNAAALLGGAINAWNVAAMTIEACSFTANATISGGAIHFVSSDSPHYLSDSTFCDNTPNHIVGPFENLGGNTFLADCDGVPGDLNGDGTVDVSDLLILLAAWGECPAEAPCIADLNADGIVDVSDLLILLAHWH